MNNLPNCPKCNSEYVYEDGVLLVCPECAYEWDPEEVAAGEAGPVAIDANGNKQLDRDEYGRPTEGFIQQIFTEKDLKKGVLTVKVTYLL